MAARGVDSDDGHGANALHARAIHTEQRRGVCELGLQGDKRGFRRGKVLSFEALILFLHGAPVCDWLWAFAMNHPRDHCSIVGFTRIQADNLSALLCRAGVWYMGMKAPHGGRDANRSQRQASGAEGRPANVRPEERTEPTATLVC